MKKNRLQNKTIEIGGIVYKVKYVKGRKIYNSKSLTAGGSIDYDKRIIEIQKGLPISEEIVVIIHELMHGALEAMIPAEVLEENREVEELIVGPFARILTGALRSAKLLVE